MTKTNHKNEQQRSTANPKVFHLFNMFSNGLLTLDDLTNRLSFSVDCTFIDNDIRHHSGQNVVDSRGALLTGEVHLPISANRTFEIMRS